MLDAFLGGLSFSVRPREEQYFTTIEAKVCLRQERQKTGGKGTLILADPRVLKGSCTAPYPSPE